MQREKVPARGAHRQESRVAAHLLASLTFWAPASGARRPCSNPATPQPPGRPDPAAVHLEAALQLVVCSALRRGALQKACKGAAAGRHDVAPMASRAPPGPSSMPWPRDVHCRRSARRAQPQMFSGVHPGASHCRNCMDAAHVGSTISSFSPVLRRMHRVRTARGEDGIVERIAELSWALRGLQMADKVNSGAVGLTQAPSAPPYGRDCRDLRSYDVVLIAGDTATAKTMVSGRSAGSPWPSWGCKC